MVGGGGALARPPADTATGASASSSPGDAQTAVPAGGFFTSLKQAFKHDYDHEVVRGHFDVGSPPDAHRYYCLVDAKTGKREPNGVAGHPVLRDDGMTGIQSGAVSFYSCVTAEQLGTLVTAGYVLNAGASRQAAPVSPVQRPASVPEQRSIAEPARPEIVAAFERFIAGQNAHDRSVVAAMLLNSKDFVWAQDGDVSIWGHREALDAFQAVWKGGWRMDPQVKELRIGNIAPGVAVLIAPLLISRGDPGATSSTATVRWGGVFVKTTSGWRISSIFVTPLDSRQKPAGN